MCIKTIAETIKAFAEVAAFGCAGGFFLWKWISGYQIVNLALSLQSQRTARDANTDLLVVSATLTKGDQGSLEVHDAKARFTNEGQIRTVSFISFERFSYTTESLSTKKRYVIEWDKRSTTSPFLQLTPGESSCFSCYVELPKN